MITEWEDLEGRTIRKVIRFFLGGYILVFEDGEYARIYGEGEEVHGSRWPEIGDDGDSGFIREAIEEADRASLASLEKDILRRGSWVLGQDHKVCPLRMVAVPDIGWLLVLRGRCLEERCAWWGGGWCALLHGAARLSSGEILTSLAALEEDIYARTLDLIREASRELDATIVREVRSDKDSLVRP